MKLASLLLGLGAVTALGCDAASSARESIARPPQAATSPETSTASAASDAAASAQPAESPPTATVALPPRGSDGLRETTFDDIKFPMEKTETFDEAMLTDRVRALVGERIRIRGYMFPTSRKRGLTNFVLVRDNMECCFGPGAALFDCVLVNMKEGATAEFSIRPIAVEGEFRFQPVPGPDGRTLAIYQLVGEAVK